MIQDNRLLTSYQRERFCILGVLSIDLFGMSGISAVIIRLGSRARSSAIGRHPANPAPET
jgi:hypothetical protein